MDMEEAQCDATLKPPIHEYCNVHNPCPGDGAFIASIPLFTEANPRTLLFELREVHVQNPIHENLNV